MRVPHRSRGNAIELQLTPMIDVVFLLLVFFLWTSSFDLPEFDLPSALAEPPLGLTDRPDTPPPVEAFDELVIGVAAEGEFPRLTLNGEPVESVSALRDRLRQIVEIGVQPPVVVDPDAKTPVGMVIDIYDAARDVGLDRVLFAADAED